MKILIVGGGIAGFTFALLLEKHGFKPHLFETAPEFRPLGLGINLLPHSTRVLRAAEVLEPIAAASIKTREASSEIYGTRASRFLQIKQDQKVAF